MEIEIVGAQIGTLLTTDPKRIAYAIEEGKITDWLDRPRMEFMSACDLGKNWDDLAKAPTLFLLDENNKIIKE